jgi:hypothetical protein
MDPPTLATAALFTPAHPAVPALYLGGALALATVAVCGWAVESTQRARREAALAASGPLPRSPSEVELMDYTRIPDAEEPASARADVAGEWA